jgi:hypothetical protein
MYNKYEGSTPHNDTLVNLMNSINFTESEEKKCSDASIADKYTFNDTITTDNGNESDMF